MIEQIRRFDRFYEAILRKALRTVASEDFSAADVRVLNELGWSDRGASGAWLSYRLDLDPARVCRVLNKLEAYGLVSSATSPTDARMRIWDLTPPGRQFADRIESKYRERVLRLLLEVSPDERGRLVGAMGVITAFHRTRTARDTTP